MSSPDNPSRDAILDVLEGLAQYGIPPEGSAHLIDVGSEKFVQFFDLEFFELLVSRGGSTCRILEGAYGSGKTHLLQLLRDVAFQRGMAVVSTDLSRAIGLEDWRQVVQHSLEQMEARIEGQTFKSLARIMRALGSTNKIRKKFTGSHPGFAQAMNLAFLDEPANQEGRALLDRFLSGDRISVMDLKKCGVKGVKDPLSSRNAEHVLATVASGLRHYGLDGTALFFDENERTLSFQQSNPPKRIVTAANLLRRLIDQTVTGKVQGLIAVFAVLPGFTESCALAYPALGQRIQIAREHDDTPGWRTPVLPVGRTSDLESPELFVERLSDRFVELTGHSDALGKLLKAAGIQIVKSDVSSGYKRQLVKHLAVLSLEHFQQGS